MTRVLLTILAVIEVAIGALGLAAAANIFFADSASMAMLFLPLLALVALLLIAGAAIFIRRPWSCYVHIAVILLAGIIFALYVGSLLAADMWYAAVMAAVVVIPLTAIFVLRPVRRYFGVIA